jgi:hypothetical protein
MPGKNAEHHARLRPIVELKSGAGLFIPTFANVRRTIAESYAVEIMHNMCHLQLMGGIAELSCLVSPSTTFRDKMIRNNID